MLRQCICGCVGVSKFSVMHEGSGQIEDKNQLGDVGLRMPLGSYWLNAAMS